MRSRNILFLILAARFGTLDMDYLHPLLVIALNALLFFSCGSSRQDSSYTGQPQGAKETSAPTLLPIPPNNCRVVATVESIDDTMRGANEKDPCSKAPCTATIKIDSVLGYGSAFPAPLARSQTINVTFAFTLNATGELLPDVKPALPGLSIGSKFEALVRATSVMGKPEPSFAIYGYNKK